MPSVLLYSSRGQELRALSEVVRDLLARRSGEPARFLPCAALERLEGQVDEGERVDVACLDVTVPGALQCAERFRARYADALLALIVDETISPRLYIRPTVLAAALLLRPFARQEARATMQEVFLAWERRSAGGGEPGQFAFSCAGESCRVPYEDILYFESRQKHIFLRTRNREYGFYATLERLEERLPACFLRCHKSYIINTRFLRSMSLAKSSLHLDGEIEVPVSRTYKSVLRTWKEAHI